MRLSKGVEWAVHACAVLALLPRGRTLSGAKLAEYLGVPGAYLAKQMQALSRAALVETSRGAAGGYRLARAPGKVTLDDIALAIEGRVPAFRCLEVRQRGPVASSKDACTKPCGIATSFWNAERAWHAALAKVSLVDMLSESVEGFDAARAKHSMAWVAENAR